MKTINCDMCGALMYKFGDKYYCPNCDDKPQEKGEDNPHYIG